MGKNQVYLCYLSTKIELFQIDFKEWLAVYYDSTTDINMAGESVTRFDLYLLICKKYLYTTMFYRSATI
jgi:hypothetical protein